MTITETDAAAVLDKMQPGEFVMVLVVKGDGDEVPDEVVTYPPDGTPLPAATVQQVIAWFLRVQPIPRDETPNEKGTAYLNAETDGTAKRKHTTLGWVGDWVAGQFRGTVGRGRRAAEQVAQSEPMP